MEMQVLRIILRVIHTENREVEVTTDFLSQLNSFVCYEATKH